MPDPPVTLQLTVTSPPVSQLAGETEAVSVNGSTTVTVGVSVAVSWLCTVSVAVTVMRCVPAVAWQVTVVEAPVCAAPSTVTACVPDPPVTLQLTVTAPPVSQLAGEVEAVRVSGVTWPSSSVTVTLALLTEPRR